MEYLAATLFTLGATLRDRTRTPSVRDGEGGSVTIENVLWAVASIAFVGIVVVVIKSFVTTAAAQIK